MFLELKSFVSALESFVSALKLRCLVDDDGKRERERESEEPIYIQKKSGREPH